ncbi:MAG: hypothetical protein DHS20C20_13720 [Ardenticatenaceae bacterium]|nr:MAG: hypothetical protein DHS20C20_13720 [Ardenticatenaceae bacterium]
MGFLCWLPISIDRLRLGANAAELIRSYDPASPPPIMVNFSWVFWIHTLGILAALASMGGALALATILPVWGWVVMATSMGGAFVGLLIWHDWPRFLSYIIVLVLAIGLI